jgi:hypothetical protein
MIPTPAVTGYLVGHLKYLPVYITHDEQDVGIKRFPGSFPGNLFIPYILKYLKFVHFFM